MSAHAQLRSLERLVMPGPVASAHAETEADCSSCHVRFDRASQRDLCLGCHEEIAADLSRAEGFHGRSPQVAGTEQCATCHTDHKGRDADILGLDAASFDHDLTDFALRGAHAEAECEGCHAPDATFHAAETECVACHVADDRHQGNLGEQCADCHVETEWAEARFDHAAVTGYALTGAHAGAACAACHVDEQYAATSDRCIACHRADDVHSGTNGSECASCHGTADWAEVRFDHFDASGFALDGAHAGLDCESCHAGNKFEVATPTECHGCHAADDVHEGVNGTECASCHRASRWLDVAFDHALDADFALTGAHAEIECAACHVEPVAAALPGDLCIDCHRDDDPHAGQLGEDCASCHGETLFTENVRFDHDFTRFPLLGKHDDADCGACHVSHAYLDAGERCIDCHRDDDAHDERLGLDCERCHTPNDWLLWLFDHDAETRFALDGAHERIGCVACHREPLTENALPASACAACHRSDDVHRGAFGRDCERCHTTASFEALKERP